MPKSFGSAIDFLKIPAINFVVYTNATAPAGPVSGMLWNDSGNNALKVYLSGAWVQIDNTGVAAAVHTHAISDVTGLQTALNNKSDIGHVHNAGTDITTGTLPVARGGTGTGTAPVAGGVIFGASTSAYGSTAVGTAGQVLVSAGAGTPVFTTIDMSYLPDSVFKKSVKAASTANLTLSATQTVDGVSLAAGDRVLVKDQTTTNQNGIYLVAAGAWTRVLDADIASEIAGAVVSVDQGTVNGGQLWKTTFKTTDTLGTTGMVWYREVDSSFSVTAGTGLTGGGALSGSVTLNVAYSADGVSTANTAVQATDSRLSNSRTPTGSAGGVLAGTYPNPTLAANGITDNTPFSAAMKDGAAGTATLRSLGFTSVTALAGNTRLDQMAVPTASVNLNSQKITGLLDPTSPQDAATKAYVDATSVGLDIKPSVRAASTANVALTGTQTIDGVSLIAGDRVLLKNQTTASENGIWVVAAGAWARSTDADTSAEVNSGMFTFVEEGTVNDNSGWVLGTNNPITLGTTGLTFIQFSGAGSITAGNGLTQTGSTIDVVGTTNRISVAADSIDISASYVGQASITTLGTVTTGTWNATAVAVLYGGTGSTTAAGARANLGAVGKYAATLGALVAGSESTITHSLNTTDVQVMFRDASSGFDILFNWRVIDANSVGVTADVAYSASAVRAVVMG